MSINRQYINSEIEILKNHNNFDNKHYTNNHNTIKIFGLLNILFVIYMIFIS